MTRLDDVKILLGLDGDNTVDAKLNLIIAGVEKTVEEMTGFKVTQEVVEEILNGTTARKVLLKYMPVSGLNVVQYHDGDSWIDFDEDVYELDGRLGEVIFAGGTPRGVQNIKINYTAGDATLQADINDAINDYVMQKFSTRPGVKSESVDGASVTFADPESIQKHPVFSQYIRI